MAQMKVKTESLPTRCEICHKADCFDPETGHCTRCASAQAAVQQRVQQHLKIPKRPLFTGFRTSRVKLARRENSFMRLISIASIVAWIFRCILNSDGVFKFLVGKAPGTLTFVAFAVILLTALIATTICIDRIIDKLFRGTKDMNNGYGQSVLPAAQTNTASTVIPPQQALPITQPTAPAVPAATPDTPAPQPETMDQIVNDRVRRAEEWERQRAAKQR